MLSIKRKAIKHLGEIARRSFEEILIRDIDDNHYPYSGTLPDFKDNPAWKKFYFVGHEHDGIKVLVKRYFAYRDLEFGPPRGEPKLKGWDFTKQGEVRQNDVWSSDDDRSGHYAVYHFWQNLDQHKQAHFEIVGIIKYENIIEIDPDGDIYAQCPHIYVKRLRGSFFEGFSQKLTSRDSWGSDVYLPSDAAKLRVKIFPEHFPEPPPPDVTAKS